MLTKLIKDDASLTYQKKVNIKNQKKVLQELWFDSPLSRSALAARCGINKSTTTYIASELLKNGLVKSIGMSQAEVGHPIELLELNKDFGYVIGSRVTFLDARVAICDFRTNILWQTIFPTTEFNAPEDILDAICSSAEDALSSLKIDRSKLLGFGFSGLTISETDETPNSAANGINLYPIDEYISSRLGVPVIVNQSAANSARTEKWTNKNCSNETIFCIEINRFIGCGAIIKGNIYSGRDDNYGGLLSHIVLDQNGSLCSCGKRGCWSTMGSLSIFGDMTVEDAAQLARQGDKEMLQKFTDIGRCAGKGIALVFRIVNPDRIVLSGPIVHAHDLIEESMYDALFADLSPNLLDKSAISFSKHNVSSPLMGAILSVIEQYLV